LKKKIYFLVVQFLNLYNMYLYTIYFILKKHFQL